MENLGKEAKYVDIFATVPDDEAFNVDFGESAIFGKSDKISTLKSRYGDGLFNVGEYSGAMELYTSSLSYAEIGTTNAALAHAKRSTCFYCLGMYEEALVDIQLAENAGMPDNLLEELKKREMYLTLINTEQRQPDDGPMLHYAANKQFPCLANVVDVKCNEEFGRHIVANSDIPQDKVIVVEEAFAVNYANDFKVCYTCFRAKKNFIPCEGCVYAVFCNSECMDRNKTHAYECGTFFGELRYIANDDVRRYWLRTKLVIKTVLKALSIFRDVKQLMEFVENTLCEHPHRLPTSTNDEISKYRVFFKLKQVVGENCLIQAKWAYKLMMKLPKIRALFDTHEKQCFLMYLIVHHMLIICTNSFSSHDVFIINAVDSFFNHSCDPNVRPSFSGNTMLFETSRLVQKGEQLFISYLTELMCRLPKEDRQSILQTTWGFTCKCSKCESE